MSVRIPNPELYEEKVCNKCKLSKSTGDFPPGLYGRRSICRECSNKQHTQAAIARIQRKGKPYRKLTSKRANMHVGDRFGRLTILNFVSKRDKKGYAYPNWADCQCDCGNIARAIYYGSLSDGHSRSCGCLLRERLCLPYGEGAFNKLYERYKRESKQRRLDFRLTPEEFRKLTQQTCHYCGCSAISTNRGHNGDYKFMGIDRKDNAIGYVHDNVVPCCKICNRAKGTRTYLEFITWIDQLIQYRKNKCITPA